MDASVAVTWFFEDEITKRTKAILDGLPESRARVPCMWPVEVANALLVAVRRKRLDRDEASRSLGRLSRLPIAVEPAPGSVQLRDIFALAAEQSLTVYDAAYLDLARREGFPLATDDDALRRAARVVGVRTL